MLRRETNCKQLQTVLFCRTVDGYIPVRRFPVVVE